MKKPFKQRILESPILCDGAMGTLLNLYEYDELPHEIQNIKNPDIIERIHREYIEAGSEIIEANTFSANRFRLSQYHLEDKLEEINRAGVEIAKRAASEKNVYVAGAVGPTGMMLEPIGKLKKQQARDAFKEQIEILLKAEVDVLFLETFVSVAELDEALSAAKELTNEIPVVAQKAFAEDGAILSGNFPIEVIEHLLELGADIVGANCTVGPQRMFSIIKNFHKSGVILSAQPAAGIPTLLNGRSIYHTTPEYLAQYAKELVEAGVTLIGACCGSTPSHIRAIAEAIRGKKVGERIPDIKVKHKETNHDARITIHESSRSRFANNIGKKFLTTVELDIPHGTEISPLLEGAKYLHNIGIDAVNITDGARARLRMSAVAISSLIQQYIGIEVITHQTTRDRNLIGIQSELLGAHILGLRNILCVTGDPAQIGDYPQAQSVFDVDSIGLIRAVTSMNNGTDLMGNSIGQSTSFLVCCAANPTSTNIEQEVEKLEKKISAGAEIIFTQPLYEIKTVEMFVKRIEHLNIPVMLGVLPLRSYKHADFLHNEVPGMRIPETIREVLHRAGDTAHTVGIEVAKILVKEAKPMIAGIYILPPFQKYIVVEELLKIL
ncbi:MAG: bifunctional homocysteine S-methyltransferase/methylenetetrahydrofolate reductase [Ignavibacteria bacterium]|nr:bifunctional homocysteine S-methyltransferase/methylenetetrahydrofolate reductase [Ignavibacteria bacterium]